MADAHVTTKTDEQRISTRSIIIKNALIFADSVEKWDNKPTAENTWHNFKNHFTATKINYKKARPADTTA